MKEFKSIGFNLDAMTPLLIPLFVFLYVPDMLDVFFNNYIYIIGGVLFYALFCITVVKVNREGIRKELYLAPITLKRSCLLYTSPSPRDITPSRMPSSA